MSEGIYGTDYDTHGEITSTGDIKTIQGYDNALQQIENRLLTLLNFYEYLTDYGSQIHEIIGDKKSKETLQLFELYIKNCLSQEPRVKNVIKIESTYKEYSIETIIELTLIDEEEAIIEINMNI